MLTIVVFVLLAGVAAAQVPLEIDFGVRGGMLVQNAYQTNPFCCRYFPTPPGYVAPSSSLSFQNGHATFGPAIGALLYDRVELRFEAVYERFGYRTQSDLTAININQHSVATTTGRSWEFPLLATYRFSRGPVRPFAGGGIGLGENRRFTTEYQTTSTTQSPTGPVTTTTSSRFSSNPPVSTAYHITGGLEGRTSYVSIRPEVRYTRFPDEKNSGNAVIRRANEFELLIGISVHPLRVK